MSDDGHDVDIPEWCDRIVNNMRDWEDREIVIHHQPLRNAVAHWIIRCLANPQCDGSAEVLFSIHERRETLRRARDSPDEDNELDWDRDMADALAIEINGERQPT